MQKKPTTREIAAACGCNQSTVSRALSNNPLIAEETRVKVLKAAEDLGWQPNPFASVYMAHLRSTRPSSYRANLAFLVSNPRSPHISDLQLHLRKHYEGASARARELGYQLETIWMHEPGLTAKRLLKMLQSRNIPGLILPKVIQTIPGFDEFEWKYFACAALGYSFMKPQFHRVATHTMHGVNLLIRKAHELGYRHIAIMVSDTYDQLIDHSALSAAYYHKYHSKTDTQVDIYTFPDDTLDAIKGIQTWLRKIKPQVVIGLGVVLPAIHGMKWRMPQDVAFISLERAPEYPDMAGFNQRHEIHGSIAVDLVVSQITNNERGVPKNAQYILVEGKWEDGLSAPPFAEIPSLTRSAAELPWR